MRIVFDADCVNQDGTSTRRVRVGKSGVSPRDSVGAGSRRDDIPGAEISSFRSDSTPVS
jgi:hypothetical protein